MQRKQQKAKPAKVKKIESVEEVQEEKLGAEILRQGEHGLKGLIVNFICVALSIYIVQLAPLPSVDVLKPNDSTSFLTMYLQGRLNHVDHITQMLIAAAVSVVLDVGVVYYHLANPPHPKFSMILSRKLSIYTHLISGITEIVSGVLAFTVGDPQLQHAFAVVMSFASITHALTAYYQTGVVFGAKGVMVPGYLYAITIHITNAFRLHNNPASLLHLLYTFLVLHIYVWCRFFVYGFRAVNAFKGFQYTISISFSGLLLFPYVMGPIGNYGMLFVVLVYCVLNAILSDKKDADLSRKLFVEHERYALLTKHSISEWKNALHGSGSADEGDKKMAKSVFDKLDTNKSGTIGVKEVNQVVTQLKIPQLTTSKLLEMADVDRDGEITFDEFYRFVWNFGSVKTRLGEISKESLGKLDEKAQAKLVFDMLDLDNSGFIGVAELEILLTQWGMPDGEAELVVRKYGGSKKRISFDLFRKQFKPVWSFAIQEVYDA